VPNRHRILLVDDDRSTLSGLFMVLVHAGYSVLTADDGQQALDLLDRGVHPRAIIMDLKLPKVSGWEVLKHIQTDPDLRKIPILIVTAGEPEDVRDVIADAILFKPLDLDEVLVEIGRLTAAP
jgi:CheY-like chemotaxis protein